MSDRPILVLTRPEAQSQAVSAQVRARLQDDPQVLIAPVIDITATGASADLGRAGGVIVTSANALAFAPDLAGLPVYCVGERTAAAARKAGGKVALVAPDAQALIAARPGPGPLIHLRGVHARGEIANNLNMAGIEAHEAILYDQKERPLDPMIQSLLISDLPVVLPIYSPRTAKLLRARVPDMGTGLHTIALSPAVAQAWGDATETCARPDGGEMLDRIVAALSSDVA